MKAFSTYTLLFLLFTANYSFAQDEAMAIREQIDNATESQLIDFLKGNQLELKNEAARKIRLLVDNSACEIKPGNIYEHKLAYWKNKVGELPVTLQKEDFLYRYEIQRSDFKPDFRKIKYYRLDHFFILRTKLTRRKVNITRLFLDPVHFKTEPPAKFSGTWKDYFVNGKLHSSTQYTNGIKNGTQKIFYEHGQMSWINTIKNDNFIQCDAYYPNGKLRRSYKKNWEEDENWPKI